MSEERSPMPVLGRVDAPSSGDEVERFRVRPVAEFDATADRCLMLQLDDPSICLNGHAVGDASCDATKYRRPVVAPLTLFEEVDHG